MRRCLLGHWKPGFHLQANSPEQAKLGTISLSIEDQGQGLKTCLYYQEKATVFLGEQEKRVCVAFFFVCFWLQPCPSI